MGKMVRVITGSIIDIFLDIRKDSPTYGYMGAYKLNTDISSGQWIYVPEGFAHGCVFLEDSIIEYFCTAEYSGSTNEACIKIFDPEIKWDYVDKDIYDVIELMKPELIMSERDKNGLTLDSWTKHNIDTFKYIDDSNDVLVTGGSGLLGKTLQKKLKGDYPTHAEFDILNYSQMDNFIASKKYKTILHCAAYTNVPKAETETGAMDTMNINISGTLNLVNLCKKYNIKLIYISTDYVFDGTKGNYKEHDPTNPINNNIIMNTTPYRQGDKINKYDLNYVNGKKYSNIFEMRKLKNYYLINCMPKKVKHYILINYESLLYNYNETLLDIKNKFNLIQKHNHFVNIKKYKKSETYNFVQQRVITFSKPLIELIWNNLNVSQENKLGYFQNDNNRYFKNKNKNKNEDKV
jgi:dTDP-4-dehydrorhamnose 3,5-epimerase-like enzyme